MLWFIIVILSIALTTFITLYFMSKKSINNIAEEVERIGNSSTNSKVRLDFSNRELEALANSINKILDQKQKTETDYQRMDKDLRQAIANMSHDLRTPLTSIMGYLQLIEDASTTEEDRNKYINIVKTRSRDLQKLTESFYDLSRLDAREYKLKIKPVNLHSILSEQIVAFYNDFTARKIEPSIVLEDNLPLVMADENGVRRIFSNLIQNMLRYSNSEVVISLEKVENSIITIFKNDAPALKQEDVPFLFHRFYTGDKTRTSKSTGLGLSITKELLELMGYSITVELNESQLSMIINWGTVK